MDWDTAMERNGEALKRIVLALAAMAGVLEAAGCGLPRDIYRAVLGPLRAAEAAARRQTASGCDPAAANRLRRRFAALCRAIGDLTRQLSEPARDSIRRATREAGRLFGDLRHRARRAKEWSADTS